MLVVEQWILELAQVHRSGELRVLWQLVVQFLIVLCLSTLLRISQLLIRSTVDAEG
jgi:hypothetical protein